MASEIAAMVRRPTSLRVLRPGSKLITLRSRGAIHGQSQSEAEESGKARRAAT